MNCPHGPLDDTNAEPCYREGCYNPLTRLAITAGFAIWFGWLACHDEIFRAFWRGLTQ